MGASQEVEHVLTVLKRKAVARGQVSLTWMCTSTQHVSSQREHRHQAGQRISSSSEVECVLTGLERDTNTQKLSSQEECCYQAGQKRVTNWEKEHVLTSLEEKAVPS